MGGKLPLLSVALGLDRQVVAEKLLNHALRGSLAGLRLIWMQLLLLLLLLLYLV